MKDAAEAREVKGRGHWAAACAANNPADPRPRGRTMRGWSAACLHSCDFRALSPAPWRALTALRARLARSVSVCDMDAAVQGLHKRKGSAVDQLMDGFDGKAARAGLEEAPEQQVGGSCVLSLACSGAQTRPGVLSNRCTTGNRSPPCRRSA